MLRRREADPGEREGRPLVEIDEKTGPDMIEKPDNFGFTMPGLKQAMAVAAE